MGLSDFHYVEYSVNVRISPRLCVYIAEKDTYNRYFMLNLFTGELSPRLS